MVCVDDRRSLLLGRQRPVDVGHLSGESAVDGVVFQQVSQPEGIGHIGDDPHCQEWVAYQEAEDIASDPSEPYLGHFGFFQRVLSGGNPVPMPNSAQCGAKIHRKKFEGTTGKPGQKLEIEAEAAHLVKDEKTVSRSGEVVGVLRPGVVRGVSLRSVGCFVL